MQGSFDFLSAPRPTLSVSELNQHVRHLLERDPILEDVWLAGEISNWRPVNSGHIYFTLKDAKASVRCVIWKSAAAHLRYLPQREGEAVQVHGRVTVYDVRGEYQVIVDQMEAMGRGRLYEEFERLKQQLAAEGLFDEGYKLPLPRYPRRIGVVTSSQAAALRDILNVLGRRYPLAEVILSPAAVQGEAAPAQLVTAIIRLIELDPLPDVIILSRGGGSIEDLWAFNNELLARTIVSSQVPIISGVGHETDFTIADFVAAKRAPTPSAAAEIATPSAEELGRSLQAAQSELHAHLQDRLTEYSFNLSDRKRRLIQHSPRRLLEQYRQRVDDLQSQLTRTLGHQLKLQQAHLTTAQVQLRSLDPKNTLVRGYAIVQKADGRVVSSPTAVQPGERLRVTVAGGEFGIAVEKPSVAGS